MPSLRLRCDPEDGLDAGKEIVAPGLSFLPPMQLLMEMLHLVLSPVLIFCSKEESGL